MSVESGTHIRLGKDTYRTHKRIAQGGQAEVLLASRTTAPDDLVALKRYKVPPLVGKETKHASLINHDVATMLANGIQEATLHSLVSEHPNVVTLRTFGVDPDDLQERPCLVFDLADSTAHDAIATGQPMAPKVALTLVEGIAHGLTAAHSAGVLHRDVKPKNILLAERAMLTDFGIAKPLDEYGRYQRLDDFQEGSPGYAAPEVHLTKDKAIETRQSDVYGLGVTTYALLTGGGLPYLGADHVQTVIAQVSQRPASFKGTLLRRGYKITPTLAAIQDALLPAVNLNPYDRPSSPLALVEDLWEALEEGEKERHTTSGRGSVLWGRHIPVQGDAQTEHTIPPTRIDTDLLIGAR